MTSTNTHTSETTQPRDFVAFQRSIFEVVDQTTGEVTD